MGNTFGILGHRRNMQQINGVDLYHTDNQLTTLFYRGSKSNKYFLSV